MATVDDLIEANETGVIVAQKLAIMVAPWVKGNSAPDPLFDDAGVIPGALSGLNLQSVGLLKKKTGTTLTPDLKSSDIESYGRSAPTRRLVQTEGGKLEFGLQEARKIAWEIQTNLRAGAFQTTASGGFRASKEALTPIRYWTVFVLGQDVNDETLDPIFQWFWFKKVGMDSAGKISLAQDAEAMPDVEFSLFQDGKDLYEFGIDGPGFRPLLYPLGYTDTPPASASSVTNVSVGGATAGTFTLTYKGKTTAAIAYNATASAVKSALVAANPDTDAADWTVTGSAPNWVVTAPDGSAVTGSGTGLTGGAFTATPA